MFKKNRDQDTEKDHPFSHGISAKSVISWVLTLVSSIGLLGWEVFVQFDHRLDDIQQRLELVVSKDREIRMAPPFFALEEKVTRLQQDVREIFQALN